MTEASESADAARWDDLGLSPRLLRAVQALGLDTPSPVQTAAIPAALAGQDVLACAPTGSGKTLAYALPLLQRLAAHAPIGKRRPQALVLVPTRELAAQVGETLQQITQGLPTPVKLSVLYGGVSINPQLMALRAGADVVVATPGRLLDVLEHNGLRLDDVHTLVLDEADRLLDSGFADELAGVLRALPARRQNLLFSATFPAEVDALAHQLLRDPLRVDVAPAPGASADTEGPQGAEAAAPLLTERAIEVDSTRRTPLLRQLIAQEGWPRVMVFVATRYACDHVADKLRRAGLTAEAFHGDASQGARTRLLAAFKAGELQVLVATDLAGRGIDIAQLPVVVNYDLPRAAVDYVHRIGRTARAGASGLAISFISPATEAHFRLIEKRQGHRVPRERIAGFGVTETAPAGAASGGIKGKRPSKKDKLRAAAAGSGD
ncbi:DEAD/DEAH box helicase [Ideonella sp. B7]|uniref:DEAD/DEAH box helicase n=1 Tax=Ideonella benzenivorans TaxID=2831643 RepID=UPI001CEDB78E|nr:DEAD/DEAH box helicase [Ideonella benzenivorans]MCA6215773.1 DEAD/DEAH box helicase [Ideonella benzenivorans]